MSYGQVLYQYKASYLRDYSQDGKVWVSFVSSQFLSY